MRDLGGGAARLLRLLGLHPGPDISIAAAASLDGSPVRHVGGLLTELSRANLLTEHSPGRYTFHDLLRTYASELAARDECAADRRAATRRCLDHYLHAAHDAAMLLDAHRTPLSMAAPHRGVTSETAADYAAAVRWFAVEYRVLLRAVDLALAAGYDTHTWQLSWALVTFLDRQGRWPELIAVQSAALTAARRLADLPGQARAHSALGRAHAMSGHARQAETHLAVALRVYGELRDPAGSSCAHLDLATLRAMGGSDRSALRHAERALDLYRTLGHSTGAPRALQVIGRQHARLGAYGNGLDHLHRACRLQEAGGDQRGNQETWRTLGEVYHRLGRYPEASSCYRRAVDLCHSLGDRYYEADALRLLGRTRYAAGEVDWARASWGEALTILEHLAHPAAVAVRADLRDPADVGPPVV
jgi:tetratricopeptide (TPR) repeat protein